MMEIVSEVENEVGAPLTFPTETNPEPVGWSLFDTKHEVRHISHDGRHVLPLGTDERVRPRRADGGRRDPLRKRRVAAFFGWMHSLMCVVCDVTDAEGVGYDRGTCSGDDG